MEHRSLSAERGLTPRCAWGVGQGAGGCRRMQFLVTVGDVCLSVSVSHSSVFPGKTILIIILIQPPSALTHLSIL